MMLARVTAELELFEVIYQGKPEGGEVNKHFRQYIFDILLPDIYN